MRRGERQPLLSSPVGDQKAKNAREIRASGRALERVLWIQMLGNFVRALPIFIIEQYYYMFLVLGQFFVIAIGYYGVRRLNAWLILFFIIGNLATSVVDILLASGFTRSSIGPSISRVALWIYFVWVIMLVIFNLLSAALLGSRLFMLVASLNAWSFTDPDSLLFIASLVAVDPKDEKGAKASATRVVVHRGVDDQPSHSFFPFFRKKGTVHFCSNEIKTAKYNPITFIPKILYFQFSRLANLYTLAIVFLCLFPFSPVSPASSVLPLAFVLATSALKEFLEDLKRHKADREVNNRDAFIFMKDEKTENYQIGDGQMLGFDPVPWKDVKVGDIVKVPRDQRLPADLVLLSTSRTDGQCYLETSNLDGETNLKIRYVPTKFGFIRSEKELTDLQLHLECEGPNNRVYEFEGVLTLQKMVSDPSPQKFPIGPDNVLLRGTVLKNTEHIYGLVIYTGKDTKIEQNTIPAPQKRSHVEKGVNTKLLFLFMLQTIICIVCSVGHNRWQISQEKSDDSAWYLGTSPKFDFIYVSYVILYNTLIPLSMYVSMEMVRVINAQFINNDLKMYDEKNDIPSAARNTNIVEELGQIQYLLSDKTGTLTNNEMVFSKCSISGITYGPNKEDFTRLVNMLKSGIAASDSPQHLETVTEFFVALTVCNTVVVDLLASQIGKRTYQAASPDEVALVTATAGLGFELVSRLGSMVVISVFGKEFTYEVLNNLEFNSYRKRMSVICRGPDGSIRLYSKGADSVLFPRFVDSTFNTATQGHINNFANDGLRTLAVCWRTVPVEEYNLWKVDYAEAEIAMTNRQKKMDEVADTIEKGLTLLGAVGIEDRLQEGVPECIEALTKAGVKVWVLTGDKLETAVSVSMACKLLTPSMDTITITEGTKEELTAKMQQIIDRYHIVSTTKPVHRRALDYLSNCTWPSDDTSTAVQRGKKLALIVDGVALGNLLDHDLRYMFLRCTKASTAVICCRCTPSHKAKVVKLVSERSFLWGDGAITMAIGDGANDVPMIQRAHVGVGISGKEGRQAVLASDYAIPQFKSLRRLLFVHGNRSYDRITKLIMYSFCKNTAMCLAQFWFSFYSGFTGQMMYFDYLFTLYNSLFTAIPVLMLAIFEQPFPDDVLENKPKLYKYSMSGVSFNNPAFFRWVILGIYQSLVIFMFPYFSSSHILLDGTATGLWSEGTASYTVLIISMNLQLALITKHWTKANIYATAGSVVFYYLFMLVYCSNDWVTPNAYWIIYHLMKDPTFWMTSIIGPIMVILPDLLFRSAKNVL